MCLDVIVCVRCGAAKPWQRFRVRVGDGTTKESNLCSSCRTAITQAEASKRCRLRKQVEKQAVLNRTTLEKQTELGIPYYYPKIEKMMQTYAKTRTSKDRSYLKAHQHEPLHPNPYTAKQQLQAREHAKGWIGFYDELLSHSINLLRQTGKRPTWAQLEASADLQKLYGVYDTKRAQQLRAKG